MNVRKIMEQAQQMQEQMARDLGALEVEASVGGGMVQVKMNGHKQVLSVTIDPEAVEGDDTGMLEDLVLAAVNQAGAKVDEAMQSKLGGLASSLGGALPGF
ncbi:MAG: YbaB/EbfC family nucleoid-associated protein [Acidobacteriota bacterium]|nr:YbaB/EbfC family nucleoid-associated protein [Acidobacteriota bacterium]MDH3522262.1 YbaB/EbfC family nucleoid-associated protein [Acidobacteriota bacterium]